MEYYMDEKWQAQRENQGSHSNCSSNPSLSRSMSQWSSSTRSSSNKNSSGLTRSSSQKCVSSKSLTRNSSQKCTEFTRKCSSLAKEQKAKFYIVRRCIGMLVKWKKNGEDS